MPQTLLVDLEYVYEAQGDDDISPGWCNGVLLEGVVQVLEREEPQLLEVGAEGACPEGIPGGTAGDCECYQAAGASYPYDL